MQTLSTLLRTDNETYSGTGQICWSRRTGYTCGPEPSAAVPGAGPAAPGASGGDEQALLRPPWLKHSLLFA